MQKKHIARAKGGRTMKFYIIAAIISAIVALIIGIHIIKVKKKRRVLSELILILGISITATLLLLLGAYNSWLQSNINL